MSSTNPTRTSPTSSSRTTSFTLTAHSSTRPHARAPHHSHNGTRLPQNTRHENPSHLRPDTTEQKQQQHDNNTVAFQGMNVGILPPEGKSHSSTNSSIMFKDAVQIEFDFRIKCTWATLQTRVDVNNIHRKTDSSSATHPWHHDLPTHEVRRR